MHVGDIRKLFYFTSSRVGTFSLSNFKCNFGNGGLREGSHSGKYNGQTMSPIRKKEFYLELPSVINAGISK